MNSLKSYVGAAGLVLAMAASPINQVSAKTKQGVGDVFQETALRIMVLKGQSIDPNITQVKKGKKNQITKDELELEMSGGCGTYEGITLKGRSSKGIVEEIYSGGGHSQQAYDIKAVEEIIVEGLKRKDLNSSHVRINGHLTQKEVDSLLKISYVNSCG